MEPSVQFASRVFAPRRRLVRPARGLGDSGFPAALWYFYNQTNIRPEWIVPVLFSESGLNPAIQNLQGYPYYGINQVSGSYLQARGIDPTSYLGWSASQQLQTIVTPYMMSQISAFGALQSGTKVYQANFLPATLATATSLDSVLAVAPSGGCGSGRTSNIYCANPGLDYTKKGTITVSDLAHFVAKEAAIPYVQNVIASAYAAAPDGVGPETDPVYGNDFPAGGGAVASSLGPVIGVSIAALGLAGLVYYHYSRA